MGIDLPRDIGTKRLSWHRLHRIISHLGDGSAVVRARREFRPSLEVQLLRRIEYDAHLTWYMALDKKGRREVPSPEPIPLHGDEKRGGRSSIELDAELKRRQAKRRADLARMQREPEGGVA